MDGTLFSELTTGFGIKVVEVLENYNRESVQPSDNQPLFYTKIEGTQLHIYAPQDRHAYIYWSGDEFFVGSCKESLFRVFGKIIDDQYFSIFLERGEEPSCALPWKNYYRIDSLNCLVYDSLKKEVFSENILSLQEQPLVDRPGKILNCIESEIEAALQPYHETIIEFSGGFDSTLIAAVVRKKAGGRSVRACLWDFEGACSKEDTERAKFAAEQLSMPLDIVKLSPNMIFPENLEELSPDRPSISLAFVKARQHALYSVSHSNVGTSIAFNGHGGDHLLCDTPLTDFCLDALLVGNVPRSIRNFRSAAHHRSDSYAKLLREAMRALFARRPRGFLGKPGRWKQLYLAGCAVHECNPSLMFSRNAHIFYPFSRLSVVRAALAHSADDHFNYSQTRVILRQEFYSHYGTRLPGPGIKGHITGGFQIAASKKYRFLRELLGDGYLKQQRWIREDLCLKELKIASLGGTNFNPSLMRIICAEIFIRHWKSN